MCIGLELNLKNCFDQIRFSCSCHISMLLLFELLYLFHRKYHQKVETEMHLWKEVMQSERYKWGVFIIFVELFSIKISNKWWQIMYKTTFGASYKVWFPFPEKQNLTCVMRFVVRLPFVWFNRSIMGKYII